DLPVSTQSHPGYANAPGNGVVLWGGNGVNNVSFINFGTIVGGENNNGGDFNETEGNFGSMVSNGVGIFDGNNDIPPIENTSDSITNVNIYNAGGIYGGNDSANGVSVGSGYGIVGFGDVDGVVLINTSTGVIHGGNFNEGSTTTNFESPIPSLTGVGFGVTA